MKTAVVTGGTKAIGHALALHLETALTLTRVILAIAGLWAFPTSALLQSTAAGPAAADLAFADSSSADGFARAVGPCIAAQVCTFTDPEDIADLAGTPWLIVSESVADGNLGIAAFDTRSRTTVRFSADALGASCLPGASGGGIGLRREGGTYRLTRILHSPRMTTGRSPDAVESFRVVIDHGRPALTRIGCTVAPAPFFLNDIAPLADGGFVATHMFDPAVPRQDREVLFLAGKPTGYVVRWSAANGWTRVPGSEGTFLNGIDASPDGRWIAFAETYGHAIDRMHPDGTGRTRLSLAMQPDNVTARADGEFVVVGGTGLALVSTRRCPELRRPGCGFPALAAQVDFARGTTRTLAVGGGRSTPGFSVGVVKNGRLYLGTAFGDRITILPVGKQPATTP